MCDFIYLDTLAEKYNAKKQRIPEGQKYCCFTCKRSMITNRYGSYKYCYQCHLKYEDNKNNKSIKNISNVEVDFID